MMKRQYFICFGLALFAILLIALPENRIACLFAAMFYAVGCGQLEGEEPAFRLASFAGAGYALSLLLAQAVLPAAAGAVLTGVLLAMMLFLTAFSAWKLEQASLGSPVIPLIGMACSILGCLVLLAEAFGAGSLSLIGWLQNALTLAKIAVMVSCLRMAAAIIRKGDD